jgi:hypothetical protein
LSRPPPHRAGGPGTATARMVVRWVPVEAVKID